MSQAAELLNSLSGDSVATYTANVEEEHIIVGSDRFIRIPDSLKRLGVQRDKDIETVTFDCPRYWDKHDLSQMVIYVNYVLPNGEDGRYPVQNVVAIGTMLHFDWTISDYVTQYQGQISFLICAVMTDEEGNEKLHWNSELNQEAYISEGLECSESPIHQYPDIITHLLTRMNEVEAIATPGAMQTYTDTWLEKNHARILAEIEAKGKATLDTIPEDYTETHNMAEESVRTKADAIVGTAEGTVISVADSSDDHIRNLRVLGKTTQVTTTGTQLFNPYAEQNNSFGNATVENNGSRITVAGTYYVSWPLVLKAGVTYYINFNTVGAATNRAIRFEYPDKEITETVTNPASFTPTKDTVSVYLYAGLGTEDAIIYENVQISEGSSALPWEPYSGGVASPSPDWPQDLVTIENPEIAIHGKNLIDCSDVTLDEVDEYYHTFDTGFEPIIGETYTLSMDVATNVFPFAINIGCGQTACHSDMTPKISGAYSENGRVALTFVWRLTPTQLAKNYTKLYIRAPRYGSPTTFAATVSNVQLERGAKATEYEPYRKSQILDVPYVLPSVPVTSDGNFTDENGQQWVCDEIDFERGVYIQNIQTVVLDGSENISREERSNNTYRYVIRQYGPVKVKPTLGGYCSHFKYNIAPIGANDVDNAVSLWTTGYPYCRCDSITSVEDMSTWLLQQYENGTPVTVMGVLDSPIETPLTTAELEAFKALYTNHPNTTVLNDSGAPMQLTYNVDTKIYLDSLPKATDEQVMDCVSAWLDSHFTSAEGVSF